MTVIGYRLRLSGGYLTKVRAHGSQVSPVFLLLLAYLSVQLHREDLGVKLPAGDVGALVEVADAQGARVLPRDDGHEAAGEQPLRDVDGASTCGSTEEFGFAIAFLLSNS